MESENFFLKINLISFDFSQKSFFLCVFYIVIGSVIQ